MCVLGKRLLKDISTQDCNKKPGEPLHQLFCANATTGCDQYFLTHDVTLVRGIKGLASGVLMGTRPTFLETIMVLLIC